MPDMLGREIKGTIGIARGDDGLIHHVDIRLFVRTNLEQLYIHCSDVPLFVENLLKEDLPITCLTCLLVR